jgi:glycerol-3-phosphate dehydrogenase
MGANFVSSFVRDQHIARAQDKSASGATWDMVVIGGGATGVGVALDAASRGYSVCLLEQSDFGKGTSSRSTKLVHGGVRYLKQGNISLVREALHERSLLLKNAPHVVRDLPFIIPCPNQWQAFFYGTGLKVYDLLAGKDNLDRSHRLRRSQVLQRIATLNPRTCAAGILYHDGQFDDARLLVNLAQTASQQGATLINYARVTGLSKASDGKVSGVRWTDLESGRELESQARVVINATGPFCDAVRRLDEAAATPMVAASQGIHLVLPKRFLPGDTAMMVPKTSDGRVVFLIPWHDRAVLGTTDTGIDNVPLEPTPQSNEIEFLLETVAEYLESPPRREDILSVFTGIRPLVVAAPGARTSQLSRDHTVSVSPSGLLTITGGKWTTYRKMAEDCVNQAAELGGLQRQACRTHTLRIAGAPAANGTSADVPTEFHIYGTDQAQLDAIAASTPGAGQRLDERLVVTPAHVLWAVRSEMARSVEDVLARRTRSLFLDARAALAIAPRVAEIMAGELERDDAWQRDQMAAFTETAQHFLP